jgi:hypothetical protein
VSELLEFFSLRMSSSRRDMSQLVCVECVGKSKQDAFTDTHGRIDHRYDGRIGECVGMRKRDAFTDTW